MASLYCYSSRRSQMHPQTPADLALHDPLLRRLHSNGFSVRRARRRHENQHLHVPHPSRKHVQLRHSQRRSVHLHLPQSNRSSLRSIDQIKPHRASKNGDRPRNRNLRHGIRRNRRDFQIKTRHKRLPPLRWIEFLKHILADSAVRSDRRIGGLHVRRTTGILQQSGAGRTEELR